MARPPPFRRFEQSAVDNTKNLPPKGREVVKQTRRLLEAIQQALEQFRRAGGVEVQRVKYPVP